jgi:L-ascorbate metabolism protein UlaG (beta-lactamase superfamily)
MSSTPLDALRTLRPHAGQVALSWLGQAGFAVRTLDTTALIDPFLSPYEGRRYDSTLDGASCHHIDVVLCTHEHLDHLDADAVPAIALASPQATFVVPTPIVDMITEAGVATDRVIGMQPDDTIELGSIGIRAVPAMHGVTMADAYGFGRELSGGMVRFLGYVIDAGGTSVYHAGDTIRFDGMAELLAPLEVDAALLPINGRDEERHARGIVGNLSEREAAELAADIGAGALVPMHYDLFTGNLGDPAEVIRAGDGPEPSVPVIAPVRDRPFLVAGTP